MPDDNALVAPGREGVHVVQYVLRSGEAGQRGYEFEAAPKVNVCPEICYSFSLRLFADDVEDVVLECREVHMRINFTRSDAMYRIEARSMQIELTIEMKALRHSKLEELMVEVGKVSELVLLTGDENPLLALMVPECPAALSIEFRLHNDFRHVPSL